MFCFLFVLEEMEELKFSFWILLFSTCFLLFFFQFSLLAFCPSITQITEELLEITVQYSPSFLNVDLCYSIRFLDLDLPEKIYVFSYTLLYILMKTPIKVSVQISINWKTEFCYWFPFPVSIADEKGKILQL